MKNIQTRKNLEFGVAKNEQLNTHNKKSSSIILFSNGCHKGNVLKNLLKMLKIIHIEINDTEKLKNRFISMPILEVDDNIMNFSQAIKWIRKNNKGRNFFD